LAGAARYFAGALAAPPLHNIEWKMGTWIVGILGVLFSGGFFLYRRFKNSAKEEPVYHFSCPGCRRRLKYLARQAGHRGMCSNCKTNLEFPVPADSRQ
jgi:hypothetical protein